MTENNFYSVMNEVNALFNNDVENFDSCHKYCFNSYGKVLGHFYFNAYYAIRKTLLNAKTNHTHILNQVENITTCIDCDLWEAVQE
jgi:hypothetical protein